MTNVAEVKSSRSIFRILFIFWISVIIACPSIAGIKDEYERAQACDYSEAEFGSDVGVFDGVNVRFCISEDNRFLVYVMRNGKAWAVPFGRDYRQAGIQSMNTLEGDRLVHYQKKKGVVERKVLGRRRSVRPVLY